MKGLVTKLPLPAYMRPSVVIPLLSLPVNNHGKVDRFAATKLPLPSGHNHFDGARVPGEGVDLSQDQQSMKDVWVSVLGYVAHAHAITASSDFFLVGGNSLLLIAVRDKLKKVHRRDLALVKLFQSTTLGEMANLLREDSSQGTVTDVGAYVTDWSTET